MKIARSRCVFPSYQKMKQDIIDKKAKKYQASIERLQQRLEKLSEINDFQADHQKIKNCILAFRANGAGVRQSQKQNLQWAYDRQEGSSNQQSLNYYIEDDKQQENNYETYLKFKKKTLQRDLQEENREKASGKWKKKQQMEEELLFKHLYQQDWESSDQRKDKITKQSRQNIKKISNNKSLKMIRENAHKFYRKVEDNISRIKNIRPSSVKVKERSIQQPKISNFKEKLLYEKNKKYLTQNYMDILKKLDNTNMVKWRILNNVEDLY